MKNAARPQLGKMPERGEKITVRCYDLAVLARVDHAFRRHFTWKEFSRQQAFRQCGSSIRQEEGTTWVRGWNTPEALALQATVAITT